MKLAELVDAPVLVAGAGISGLAAAAALVELGARVTVVDANPAALADLPDGAVAGAGEDLPAGTRLVVTGPGRRPDHPLVAAAAAAGVPVVGEPELAWWIGAEAPDPPVWLAVTGTNGKTTTTGMLEAILRRGRAGRRGLREHRLPGGGRGPGGAAGARGGAVELPAALVAVRGARRRVRAQRRRGPSRLARLDGRLRGRQGAGAAWPGGGRGRGRPGGGRAARRGAGGTAGRGDAGRAGTGPARDRRRDARRPRVPGAPGRSERGVG